MLIQRNGVTTHRVLDTDIRFDDFIELVHFENFDNIMHHDQSKNSIWIPRTDTTYTLLAIHGAESC